MPRNILLINDEYVIILFIFVQQHITWCTSINRGTLTDLATRIWLIQQMRE